MKKKCCECILSQPYIKDDFKCTGGLKYTDCIARLQGAIDILNRKEFEPLDEPKPGVKRVDYALYGNGSVYVAGSATDEEIALAILDDCEEIELSIEHIDN